MSFLFLSGSPAKGTSNTGPDFKACRRAALIRRNSFFIGLEFYGIRGLRQARKKEARRIPVHYKDSVLSGINKAFGADSTECGKNRTFRRIGQTERRGKRSAKRLPVRAVSYPPLARSHSIPVFPPVLHDRFEVFPPPFFQPYQMGNQGRSEFGHAIFRFGRNGGIYFPRDQAVRDQ